MNIPPPERRRVKVSAGALPSPKIASLAVCHPFSQQLDVVFPSAAGLRVALEVLQTSYGTARAALLEVVSAAPDFVSSVEGESDLLIVSAGAQEEDAWCVDPRGHLTLAVGKEVYERLGLVGPKLPFKGYEDRHTIDIPLRRNGLSPAMQTRVKTGLGGWDERRAAGRGSEDGRWDVLFCAKDRSRACTSPFHATQVHRVVPTVREVKDVHVPMPNLCARPTPPAKAQTKRKANAEGDADGDAPTEAVEDWDSRTESLFEWVGMACLGAQRLNANDRVDPFVALYDPPSPTQVHDVTQLRWRGLLPPSFVKEVLDTVINGLSAASAPAFASVTAHALSNVPVSYIPYTMTPAAGAVPAALQTPAKLPAKVPRADSEDTWCAIFERAAAGEGVGAERGVRWCLGEALGQLDARWG